MNKTKTLLAIALTVMAFTLASPLSAADVETRKDISVAGKILEVDNLAGSVKLLEAKGDKFEIQATVKADKSAGLTAAEIADGMYQYDASAADMNGTLIIFRFVGTGADDTIIVIRTGG